MMGWIDAHPWVVGTLTLVAIAIALVGLRQAKKNQKTKTLDYTVESDVNFVSSHAPDLQGIEIHFQHRQLQRPRFVTIKFVNTGNTEIEASDFADPIRVKHGDEYKVLECEVVSEPAPGTLKQVVDVAAGSKYSQITPKFLNAGESFTIRHLYDGQEKLEVECRFKGQTRPVRRLANKIDFGGRDPRSAAIGDAARLLLSVVLLLLLALQLFGT
ncbi:hypothetical protein AB0H71_28940 [Nocardia sp. NPDC050697]|uniref:hypothetical protein n=1 Tax=Nocardia sp. NPDC050697 TaxID=3155158 RepID=UPI0033D6602F